MAFPFHLSKHTIDCQYMREYPRAITPQNAPLKLRVKKYTPVDNPNPQEGDVTLIAVQGAGCPKELYEPLWEDLLARRGTDGFRIRAIWIADSYSQGESGVLNEEYLGNDASWFDHGRDTLQMIQHFKDDMPQPLMGISHSAGSVSQLWLALWHPRLFTSLILFEPFLHQGRSMEENQWIFIRARQRDMWASKSEAIAKSKKLFAAWDPRVQERYIRFAFRELPTPLHPLSESELAKKEEKTENDRAVALTTPMHQEVALFIRPNVDRHKALGGPEELVDKSIFGPSPPHDALFVPDMIGKLEQKRTGYRPEGMMTWDLLPNLRPSALYVSGEASVLSGTGHQKSAAERTGTGVSGSGGMADGRVKHAVLPGGHTICLERVGEHAALMGEWIAKEVQKWREDEKKIQEGWRGVDVKGRLGLTKEWKRMDEVNQGLFPRKKGWSKL